METNTLNTGFGSNLWDTEGAINHPRPSVEGDRRESGAVKVAAQRV